MYYFEIDYFNIFLLNLFITSYSLMLFSTSPSPVTLTLKVKSRATSITFNLEKVKILHCKTMCYLLITIQCKGPPAMLK